MATMTVRLAAVNAQLLDTFREETTEGLDQLEARLLDLLGRPEAALIDQLFRIAHTIKGGAGTFAMTGMTRIAHRMESVLDTYRLGATPSRAQVTTLLDGTDALRRLLAAGRNDDAGDLAVEARLDALTRGDASVAAAPLPIAPSIAPSIAPPIALPIAPPIAPPTPRPLVIRMSPTRELFTAGIDPALLFDQLASLGGLQAQVELAAVPRLAALDPTHCHLAWTLTLAGGSAELVAGLFDWLVDLCPVTFGPDPLPAAAADAAAADAAAAPSAAIAEPSARATPETAGASIRVRLDKLDGLMGLIGDLMTTQSTLCALDRAGTGSTDPIRSRAALDELQRLTRLLQQSALQLRSMPIGTVLNRFPRLIHDLADRLGKEVELEILGEATELDKAVLERIGEPLVHLLRNSIDHGIESPDVREAAGKPRAGHIRVAVAQRGDEVTIEIDDDGRGLDTARILARARERGLVPAGRTLSEEEIHRLILLPGFSTAEQISEVSGRGVGMDVVVRTIQELGGDLRLRSQLGAGSTITLRLPMTLAIMDGQQVRFGGRTWIVPLANVVECSKFDPAAVTVLVGQRAVYRVGDDIVPMLDPCERLALRQPPPRHLVLVIEANDQRRALLVDELGPRQQVVIKSLAAQLSRVDALAGAVVLGDGSVAFILDVVGLCASDRAAA